jgi:hypothetical protein
MCRDLGLFGREGRKPSGILTIILKKFWPGMYSPSPKAPKKLALKWEDYQAAPCGVFATQDGRECVPSCAQDVLGKPSFQSAQVKILCTLGFVLTH